MIEILERMLSCRMPDFAKFDLNEKMHLCKVMTFERYPKVLLSLLGYSAGYGRPRCCLFFPSLYRANRNLQIKRWLEAPGKI